MNKQKEQIYFFLILLAGVIVVTSLIVYPFLSALLLAVVCAVIFYPVHRWLIHHVGGQETVAALLTMAIIVIAVFSPLTFIASRFVQDAGQLYNNIQQNSSNSGFLNVIVESVGNLNIRIHEWLPSVAIPSINISQLVEKSLAWVVNNLSNLFSRFAGFFINAFIFLLSLFYLLRDGHRLKERIVALSPLKDGFDEEIFKTLKNAITSVIRGSLIIAIVQGILTGLGCAIFGVPHPIVWGSVASVAALIPGIGTSLVLIPAIGYLFFSGHSFAAFGFLIWGALAVGLIDNMLGSMLVSRGAKIHPLLVLLSVIGGIGLFGPLGFLFGPLIVSLLLALLSIYASLRDQTVIV